MQQKLMDFLNARRNCAGDNHLDVCQAGTPAATLTEKSNAGHTAFLRSEQRAMHILALTAGGEGGQHVAFASERFDLPCKEIVEGVVVADSCEVAPVGCERDCGVGFAVLIKTADKLCGEMRSVRGTPAIATSQQLAAC